MGELEEKLNSILSSPEAMGQIMSLANALGAGTAAPQEEDAPPPPGPSAPPAAEAAPPLGGEALDPAMVRTLLRLLSEYRRDDDEKTALLLALKPFLREERRSRVERAVQLTRLSRVVRAAIELLQGGAEDV